MNDENARYISSLLERLDAKDGVIKALYTHLVKYGLAKRENNQIQLLDGLPTPDGQDSPGSQEEDKVGTGGGETAKVHPQKAK